MQLRGVNYKIISGPIGRVDKIFLSNDGDLLQLKRGDQQQLFATKHNFVLPDNGLFK
jgi:alpha-tubulin suppressor-like RCC1 family protein